MAEINRPVTLLSAGFFIAPSGREIRPFRIPSCNEVVEVLMAGKVFFETEQGVREFGRGTIFWHVAGDMTVFRTPPEDPYRCLSVRFEVPEDRRCVPRISGWADDGTLDEFVDEVVRRFHDETIDRSYLGDYAHRRLLWEAYIFGRRSVAAAYPKPLSRALAMLRESSRLDFTVAELAARAGISEPYLYALFSKYLSSSPHRYLLNYRLRLARIRLAGSDDNIKTISEECGFENIESFYRAFRRNSGMAPGEYRRRQQPNV